MLCDGQFKSKLSVSFMETDENKGQWNHCALNLYFNFTTVTY